MYQTYSTNGVKISELLRMLWVQQNSNLGQRTEMASEYGRKVLKILFKKGCEVISFTASQNGPQNVEW